MREFLDKFCFHFVFTAKNFDFWASLGDAGTQVPAWKLHTQPGYINTRIFPGLLQILVTINAVEALYWCVDTYAQASCCVKIVNLM